MLAIINIDDSAVNTNDVDDDDHHLLFLLRDHYWIEMTAQVETCSFSSLCLDKTQYFLQYLDLTLF